MEEIAETARADDFSEFIYVYNSLILEANYEWV